MYQQPNAPQPPFPSPQLRPVDPSAREARRIGKEISRRGLGMGLALIGMLVCSYLFSSGMGALLQQMGFSDYRRYAKEFSYLSPVVYYLQYAVIYLGMVIIPFAVLAICFRMKSVEFLPFRRRTGAKVTAGYIVIGCSASVLLNFMAAYFLDALSLVGLKPAVNAAPYPEGDPLALALYGVVIAVLPAFAEEFAFRGVVLGLLRPYGEVFAVAGSALLFGIMHGNVVQIPFALAGGLVLGFIAVRTGSLWPSVCIHFLNNLLSYLQEVFSHTLPEGAYYIYSGSRQYKTLRQS